MNNVDLECRSRAIVLLEIVRNAWNFAILSIREGLKLKSLNLPFSCSESELQM